ncbi:MAG: hypothetical protein E5X80_08270 [Mesorhizobium sp.]|uniref:hypothetical protein n=1 Tax=Mesorhizobium sp. TaxID=1871066 RepID=UPI000FE86FFD|nr:hypothetical protein [Mesorhizobium sp.]RWM06979.1 MAG: hypothetical protein EOR71_18035 [Mesorhizobium sp.]TIO53874.1 MAG: hypothetical protein E5X78_05810 [Mesorhizobium sp.]TIO61501.1 MAG: hypothetical protein E5X79_06955 [Mesorhizobium sp.]TJV65887.1 MAG: hypothetical protein E5X80_08270 [Mesorhizobium sp.]
MSDIVAALEQLLAENPGPISIAAGIATLRAIGAKDPSEDLQSLVGTFAAERRRAIRFDRFTGAT